MLKFLKQWLNEETLPLNPLNFEHEAVVRNIVQPGRLWRVAFEGTYWNARCNHEVMLKPGDVVYVTGRQGITLLIEPKQSIKG